ncbi:hypothetical protein FACUT_8183 [Fusarium acutatum]|uniref:Uncharacterized protein n=1 Tax=Fusarium acutatum TaxID=78861 RepID=A0A8H4NIB9_9HYPO|nr:hypothetical protein FACUT_8183 [Fusarium acutatum]
MESQAASGTPPVASMSELESQDLQGQSGNDVAFIDDYDKTALDFSIGDDFTALPLLPQETFTNPPTYSREETIRGLQQGIDQYWADEMAAQQINAGTNMQNSPQVQNPSQKQNPPQGQNTPQAPSATPDAKPIPQARARGVKRTREPEPSSRAAKRPADRNGQPATRKVKSEKPRHLPTLRPKPREPAQPQPIQPLSILPMAPVPHQQEFQANRRIGYGVDNTAWIAANRQPALHYNGAVSPGIQGLYYDSWRTRMGMDPRGVAFSDNASIHKPSPMVPQMQRMTRSILPTPMSSPGMISNPMPPQQQLANEMAMGSMLPSPVSPPGQIPIATENLLPHLNLSMQHSRVDRFPAMTAEVTTNPLSWSTQHSYDPFFGDIQSMLQPTMPRMPMKVRAEWISSVNASQSELGHHFTGLNPTTR